MLNDLKFVVKEFWPTWILCGAMVWLGVSVENDWRHCKQEKIRSIRAFKPIMKERTHLLTDYIFNDVNTYVSQNKIAPSEVNSIAQNISLQLVDERIQMLAADSIKYADAIMRYAPFVAGNAGVHDDVIGKYGRSTVIRTAVKMKPEEFCKVAMKFIEFSHRSLLPVRSAEVSRDGWQPIKKGTENPAYELKINMECLKAVSRHLADQRAVKAQMIRNLQGRGK